MEASRSHSQREDVPPLEVLRQAESACERVSTTFDGRSMVWRRWGSGPPLVLLHGGYGSWRHWIRTIPAFASRRTLLVADLPGLGDSDEVPDPVTPERVAAHVRSGIDQLIGAGTPFDLVGFSFGAMIAGHTAAALGSRIERLVLIGPGALGLTIRRIELRKWNVAMPPGERRDVMRANLSRLMLADDGKIDELAIQIQHENTTRARVRSRRFAVTDTLAQALRRASPKRLFVIWGMRDAVAQGHFHERRAFFHSLRNDVGIHLIPEAGHWVAYEAPEAFNRVLAECLDQGVPEPR
jgi:pimeloyl-ACP methyl ester carboxylesterase